MKMAETNLPEFKGKYSFPGGEFGKDVLKEYQGRVSEDYSNAKALQVLSYKDGIVKGSNPFAVTLVNQIVQGAGLRTATPADLERILKLDVLPLRGTYEDSALVLRSGEEPNSHLAGNIYVQIKARNPKQEMPVMIPLAGLELVQDSSSNYGLAFNFKDNAEIFYAPILNQDGKFSSEDIDEKTGLPTEIGRGNRVLYPMRSGLSRLYLYGGLGLYSGGDDLADSSDLGRVVVVGASAEGAKK